MSKSQEMALNQAIGSVSLEGFKFTPQMREILEISLVEGLTTSEFLKLLEEID